MEYIIKNFTLNKYNVIHYKLEPLDRRRETKERSSLLPWASSYVPKALLVLSIFIHNI